MPLKHILYNIFGVCAICFLIFFDKKYIRVSEVEKSP